MQCVIIGTNMDARVGKGAVLEVRWAIWRPEALPEPPAALFHRSLPVCGQDRGTLMSCRAVSIPTVKGCVKL